MIDIYNPIIKSFLYRVCRDTILEYEAGKIDQDKLKEKVKTILKRHMQSKAYMEIFSGCAHLTQLDTSLFHNGIIYRVKGTYYNGDGTSHLYVDTVSSSTGGKITDDLIMELSAMVIKKHEDNDAEELTEEVEG